VGVFIPLANRTLGYLIARQDERLTVRAGAPLVYTAPIELMNKDVQINKRARSWAGAAAGASTAGAEPSGVTGINGANELTETRRVDAVRGVPTITFDETNFAGPYEIKAEGAAGTVIRFAAQLDPEESNQELISEEQTALIGRFAGVVHWSPGM